MIMKVKQTIRKVLKEWYAKINKEERAGLPYKEIEKVLNKLVGKKYDWWKGIEIEEISYSEIGETITIYGVLIVDEKWGKQQWEEDSYTNRWTFPGNYGWEQLEKFDDDSEIVKFGDLINDNLKLELSEFLTKVLIHITNYKSANYVRLPVLKVKFV